MTEDRGQKTVAPSLWVLLVLILFSLNSYGQDIVTVDVAAQSEAMNQPEPPVDSATEQTHIVLPRFILSEGPELDESLRDLLTKYVTVLIRPPDKMAMAELRFLRVAVRRQIAGLLATLGYFSPEIKFENALEDSKDVVQQLNVLIRIDPGPLTKVDNVAISFVGETVPLPLQEKIRAEWALKKDAVFRDEDWTRAKTQLIERLVEHSYAAAKIVQSEALVQEQRAQLTITVDGGPAFYVGEVHVTGLKRYEPWLIERYHPPTQGEPYSQTKLVKFQRALQNSPYFASVDVNIDPDRSQAQAIPINVVVRESKKYDLGFGAGYSTNTGFRGEVSFQDRSVYPGANDLKSVIRIEQLRQIGYVDMFLPPKSSGYLDSLGVLFERTDIQGLVTQTTSFGAKRVKTQDRVEKRLGLSFVYEQSTPTNAPTEFSKALAPSIGRTWRRIDSAFDPRHGHVTQVDISGGSKLLLSDQNFIRMYGKHQQWVPINYGELRDVLILRAEAGYVLAQDDAGIPEDFLFRAGGTGSVRGYAYQSLGVDQDGSVLGGRILTTASAEYVHWLGGKWGVAGFVDAGDAAATPADLKMNVGVGAGVRYKTPAGPLAVDIAYGIQARKVRLDFSIGIAF